MPSVCTWWTIAHLLEETWRLWPPAAKVVSRRTWHRAVVDADMVVGLVEAGDDDGADDSAFTVGAGAGRPE